VGLLLRAFLPIALAYVLAFSMRSVTAVAAPGLSAELALGPDALGLITATYFAGYGLMQMPAGMLLDRFGPHRTDGVLLVLAAAGAVVFGLAEGPRVLALGRFLIGVGSGAALLAGLHAHALWLAPARLPLFNGLLFASGGIGAVLATAPAEALIAATSWRAPFLLLAALTLAAAVGVLVAAPERPAAAGGARIGSAAAFGRILRDPVFLRVAPSTIANQSAMLAYQSLWAGPFMIEVGGLAPRAAAAQLLALSVAMMAGFVATGAIGAWLERYRVPPAATFAGVVMLFLVALAWHAFLPPALGLPGWILFGAAGTAGGLAFAVLTRQVPSAIGGRAIGLLNFLLFVGAFAVQAGVGQIVALAPDPASGHLLAMRGLLVVNLAAWLWLLAGRPWAYGTRVASR
jgi:MFS family permease